MSTRSAIGIQLADDKTIKGVYCHWDGYIENGVGETLLHHYTDSVKINKLIAMGNISSLGPEIGAKHDFDDRCDNETTFYKRDRGESGQEWKRFDSEKEFIAHYDWSEYFYLFKNGKWYVSTGKGFRPLKIKVRNRYA